MRFESDYGGSDLTVHDTVDKDNQIYLKAEDADGMEVELYYTITNLKQLHEYLGRVIRNNIGRS